MAFKPSFAASFALVMLALLASASLFIGASELSPDAIWQGDEQAWQILTVSRIPRLLAIALAGAGLSVAGLIMQQIVQNRFASPSTTGTIDCAVLGYVAGMIFISSDALWLHFSSIFLCAMAGTLILVRFIQHLQFKNAVLVPLIGIMYGNVISAISTFIAYKYDLVQTMATWTLANFASVLQGNYEMLFLAIPACFIAYYFARQFNAISVGKHFATNLGLNYQGLVTLGVILVAAIAAIAVMTVGVIPFIGLIVPNVVALIMGDNLQRILPWTAYWGVVLVLLCDVIGRIIIFPYEIPIAMIISIIGGALFIYLILRDKRHG